MLLWNHGPRPLRGAAIAARQIVQSQFLLHKTAAGTMPICLRELPEKHYLRSLEAVNPAPTFALVRRSMPRTNASHSTTLGVTKSRSGAGYTFVMRSIWCVDSLEAKVTPPSALGGKSDKSETEIVVPRQGLALP